MNELFKDYLFTDLILELEKENFEKEVVLEELKNRLKFCEIDSNTIDAIIELEQIIVKKRHLTLEKKFVDSFWWLKYRKDFSKPIKLLDKDMSEYFLRYNDYYKKSEILPNNLLTFGELISFMDEATFILMHYKNISQELKSELDIFKSIDGSFNHVYNEIYFRFMAAFEMVHNSSKFPDNFADLSYRFYKNETNILFTYKWVKKQKWENYRSKKWKSYTNEYYNYYDR